MGDSDRLNIPGLNLSMHMKPRQMTITIAEAVHSMRSTRLLTLADAPVPVWTPRRISSLLGHLMQGQPIGPIAVWEVEPGTTSPTAFRRFLRHCHELENPQSQLAIHVGPTDRVTVVLDGTQRLTALNIALNGTYAERRDLRRWSRPGAYPIQRLYLNLAEDSRDGPGSRFHLQFLSEIEASPFGEDLDKWFPIIGMLEVTNSGPAIEFEATRRNLAKNTGATDRLRALYAAVHRPVMCQVVSSPHPFRDR